MLATLISSDSYLGRCLVGRIEQGKINVNQDSENNKFRRRYIERGRLTKLFIYEGTK